ncbi:unnamed protein product, partial [Brenthis ino]
MLLYGSRGTRGPIQRRRSDPLEVLCWRGVQGEVARAVPDAFPRTCHRLFGNCPAKKIVNMTPMARCSRAPPLEPGDDTS